MQFPGVMKRTCTGGEWKKSNTTGMIGGVYQMEGIHRGLQVSSECGLACRASSLRVPWYEFMFHVKHRCVWLRPRVAGS